MTKRRSRKVKRPKHPSPIWLVQHGEAWVIVEDKDDCPKRGGDAPVRFGSCSGCRYFKGPWYVGKVCTHPKAATIVAKALERAKAWEAERRKAEEQPKLF